MKPLGLLDARAVRFVLLDIDDTLTTRGKLGAQAYGALEALQRAGKKVIPVTGRPAGWCDHLARMWPVDWPYYEEGVHAALMDTIHIASLGTLLAFFRYKRWL